MSFESGQRPLTHVKYQSANSNPYNAAAEGDPYYNGGDQYYPTTSGPKKGTSKWVKVGIPIVVILIIAVGVGVGVGVTRNKNNNNSAVSGGGDNSPSGAASSAVNAKNSLGRFPTATNTDFFMPEYPSTVSSFHI